MISLQNLMQALPQHPPPFHWISRLSGHLTPVLGSPWGFRCHLPSSAEVGTPGRLPVGWSWGQGTTRRGFTSKSQLSPPGQTALMLRLRRPAAQRSGYPGLSWLPQTHQCASRLWTGVSGSPSTILRALVGLFQDSALEQPVCGA